MKLPNAERAIVEERKITEYLLSFANPRARSKARFFTGFGFCIEEWEGFAEALLSHCRQNEVSEVKATPYGVNYVIVAPLETPDNRKPIVKSVWEVKPGVTYPRLVTAYTQLGRVDKP